MGKIAAASSLSRVTAFCPSMGRVIILALWSVLGLAGCTKFDLLNATIGSCGYQRTVNLAYGKLPRQKLDVYQPREGQPGAGVVVFFYGGDWQAGNKADYRFVAEALTSRGFIAVLPDYRLYPRVTFPAFLDDGALAVRWVRDHAAEFGGNPQEIYLMGHSAGAYIAVMLSLDGHYLRQVGMDRSAICATAGLSGPYDFVPSSADRAVFGMSPIDATPDPRMEPIHFADGGAPPILLLHGSQDAVVAPSNALKLAAAIKQSGGEVRCIPYPCRGHAGVALALAWPFRWLSPVLSDTATFFNEHKNPPLTAPTPRTQSPHLSSRVH